jgi:hypothetical protein
LTDKSDPTNTSNGKGPSPLVRIAGKYGAIAGLVLTAGLVVIYFAGKHPLLINILFDLRILVFLLFIFVTLREFRDEYNNKILHFWQGLYTGIIVYISAAFITSLLLCLFASWIEPDFVTSFIGQSLANLEENKEMIIESLGQDKYDGAVEGLPSTTAGNLAFDYFLKSMPIGFILTLITSIIMRNKTT